MKKFGLFLFVSLVMAFGLYAQQDDPSVRAQTAEIRLAAQTKYPEAIWQDTIVTADGNDLEWLRPLSFFNRDCGLWYSISNDDKNIYIILSVSDQMRIRKMMTAGWSLSLQSGEKGRKFNVKFSFPKQELVLGVPPRGANEMQIRNIVQGMIDDYNSKLTEVKVKGLPSEQETIKIGEGTIQIKPGGNDKQNFINEFIIPFKELVGDAAMELNEKMTMTIAISAMEMQMGGGFGGGGMRPGGGGGMPGGGGGMRPGGGGFGGGANAALYEDVSFKQLFSLTKNKAQ